MIAGAVESVPFTERYFLVGDSLQLVSIVVIGGIASPMGAVIGALWVIGMPAFFPGNAARSRCSPRVSVCSCSSSTSRVASSRSHTRRGTACSRGRRRNARRYQLSVASPHRRCCDGPSASPLVDNIPALEVVDLTVRFGGIVAVDGVSPHRRRRRDRRVDRHQRRWEVDADERCRWIRAVRRHGAHSRRQRVAARTRRGAAREGLGRTFQAARLFPELTVRETVEVALERAGEPGFSPRRCTSRTRPSAIVASARRPTSSSGSSGSVDTPTVRISDLSTGTRRIVELAGLLALDARVLCLDEPTAGVAQRETEAFGPLIKEIRRELGAAMLIIEHDMPLIMSISDRVYCLEIGRIIAEGVPAWSATTRRSSRAISASTSARSRAAAPLRTLTVPRASDQGQVP